MKRTFKVVSLDAMNALGAALAGVLKPGDCLLLEGDLGIGKTALCRAIIRALAQDAALEVTSPTFTLVQSYDTSGGQCLWHFDLYRITHAAELSELALEEALQQAIVLVEWPEKAPPEVWPPSALRVRLLPGVSESSRMVECEGESRWECLGRVAL